MRHHIIMIAAGRRLNKAAFITFARMHSEEFGIANDRVSNFHVDELVAAYKIDSKTELNLIELVDADDARELAITVADSLKKKNKNSYPNSPYPHQPLKLVRN